MNNPWNKALINLPVENGEYLTIVQYKYKDKIEEGKEQTYSHRSQRGLSYYNAMDKTWYLSEQIGYVEQWMCIPSPDEDYSWHGGKINQKLIDVINQLKNEGNL